MMNLFTTRIFLALLILITPSCSPEKVTVHLVTGLENHSKTPNLMQTLGTLMMPIAGYCKQKNILAGVDASGGNSPEPMLDTFPVNMTNAYDVATYVINPAWMLAYSTHEPIKVDVPRGIEVGVGILGSITESWRTDASGACADFSVGPPPIPYTTYSLIGHKRIVANSARDETLKLWLIKSDVMPLPTPAGGDPNCANEADSNQNCPGKDFFRVNCNNCGALGYHLRFEYGFSRNATTVVRHWIRSAMMPSPSTYLSIPNILPMDVILVNSSTMADLQRIRFTKTDFQQGYPRMANKLFNQVSPYTTNIEILERQGTMPPAIGAFDFGTFDQQPNGTAIITWSPAVNAQFYRVRWGLAPSSYTNDSGLINTTTYNFPVVSPAMSQYVRIEASNSQGSALASSTTEFIYRPLDASAYPSCTMGSVGTCNLTWSTPNGSNGSTTYTVTAINQTVAGADVISPPFTGTTGVMSGLTAGNQYLFKMLVQNPGAGGKSYSTTSPSPQTALP